MPAERRAALVARVVDATSTQLDALQVVVDLGFDDLVTAALDADVESGLALARAANELAADAGNIENLTTDAFIATLLMEQNGELSATQAKTVLLELLAHGGDPRAIAKAKGFEQLSADSLGDIVAALIDANPDEWSRFREGDEKLAQFFIGQVMKETKGQANGKAVIAELHSRR
jgi:aspartyl-tRNA(Asn)/glutamyl-tRNA(Gln) amidotransferase subunit B